MPLLAPDVIKLDMGFVRDRLTRERARVVHAVVAEAERTNAVVLAEGIETLQQARLARTLGASLGQGWYFGRPGHLTVRPPASPTPRTAPTVGSIQETPFEFLRRHRPARTGTKTQLLQMSLALEEQARLQGDSAVLFATFQDVRHLSAQTRRRYEDLSHRLALVGALAVGLDREPMLGVRGAALDGGEPLASEWDVVVLGPHFAGAFVARDLGDDGADRNRRFEYTVTYDRELVTAAALRLARRIIAIHDRPQVDGR